MSNAPYETCRLDTADRPTYRMASMISVLMRPMKIPGVKNWYLTNSGALEPFPAALDPMTTSPVLRRSSIWIEAEESSYS